MALAFRKRRYSSVEESPPSSCPSNKRQAASPDHSVGQSKRGRKAIGVPPSMQRGLIRAFNRTNASFNDIAEAFDQCEGGLGKQWLRKFFRKVTGTKQFCDLRLSKLREVSIERNREYVSAIRRLNRISVQDEHNHTFHTSGAGVSQEAEDSEMFSFFDWSRWANSDAPSSAECVKASEFVPATTPTTHQTAADSTVPQKRSNAADERKKLDYAQRTELANDTSTTAFAQNLGRLKHQETLYMGVVKRMTIRADSFSSRCSSDGSIAGNRSSVKGLVKDLGGDANHFESSSLVGHHRVDHWKYQQHYHEPDLHNRRKDPEVQHFPGSHASICQHGSVVQLLMCNRQVAEEILLTALEQLLMQHSADVKAFVTEPDHRGVTGLHLAVAYGLPAVCGLLVNHGADIKARELQDSIREFAKAAERMASDHIDRYFWINHCREWIRVGHIPPALCHIDSSSCPVRGRENAVANSVVDSSLPFRESSGIIPSGSTERSPIGVSGSEGYVLTPADDGTALVGTTIDSSHAQFEFGSERTEANSRPSADLAISSSTDYVGPTHLYMNTSTGAPLFLAPTESQPTIMSTTNMPDADRYWDLSFRSLQSSISPYVTAPAFTESPTLIARPLALLPLSTTSVQAHHGPEQYQDFPFQQPDVGQTAQPVLTPTMPIDEGHSSRSFGDFNLPADAMIVETSLALDAIDQSQNGDTSIARTGLSTDIVWHTCSHGEPVSFQ